MSTDDFRKLINLLEAIDDDIEASPDQPTKTNNLLKLRRGLQLPGSPDFDDTHRADVSQAVDSFRKKKKLVRTGSAALTYPYEEIKDTSDCPAVNEFYNRFNESATKHGYEPFFYVQNNEDYVCGKIKSKAHDVVLEFKYGKGGNPSETLATRGFTQLIRIHIPTRDTGRCQAITDALIAKKDELPDFKHTDFMNTANSYYDVTSKTKLGYNQAIDYFWKIVNIFEALSFTKGKSNRRSGARGSITRPNTPVRYYMASAGVLYIAQRFGLPSLVSRGGKGDSSSAGIYDVRDDLITIGITSAGLAAHNEGKPTYREHAVPCDAISKIAIEMYNENLGKQMGPDDINVIVEVANMIKKNLCIVICTKEEAAMIDKVYQTTMPAGWDPENPDVLARFKAFNIPVISLTDVDKETGRGARVTENKSSF